MIVVMQFWEGDKEKALETTKSLKEKYPDVLLGALANDCNYPNEMENYCDLIQQTSEDIVSQNSGGLGIHELLVMALKMPGDVIVKIDPDTQIFAVEGLSDDSFSGHFGLFGKKHDLFFMDTTKGFAPFSLPHLDGGAMGMKRCVARRIVDSSILLDDGLVVLNPEKTSAFVSAKISDKKHATHDFPLVWACKTLGIGISQSDLLISAFRHAGLDPTKSISISKNPARLLVKNMRNDVLAETQYGKTLLAAEQFLRFAWGEKGVYVRSNRFESGGFVGIKKFEDFAKCVKYVSSKTETDEAVSVKPINDDNLTSFLVVDFDKAPDVDCTITEPEYGHFQLIFPLNPMATIGDVKEAIGRLWKAGLKSALDSQKSTEHGFRIPETPSFEKICIHNGDKCFSAIQNGKPVKLVKMTESFYTLKEAEEVISGLLEFESGLPLATSQG